MSVKTSHLADDQKPLTTLCGLAWEDWQEPDMPTDDEIGFRDLPYGERIALRQEDAARRRDDEPVVQCQACFKAATR